MIKKLLLILPPLLIWYFIFSHPSTDRTPSPSSQPAQNIGWATYTDKNPLDDSQTIQIVLKAKEGRSRRGKVVELQIRCMSGKTELIINWGDFLESNPYVTSRIGSQKASNAQWQRSSNSEATFYPYKTAEFVKKLMAADTFTAQITPYQENPITAIFDTSDLKTAIQPVRQACKW